MIGLALALLALGLSDLVAGGISGQPRKASRVAAGAITSALVLLTGCLVIGWTARNLLLAGAMTAATSVWQILRVAAPTERRAACAAASLPVLMTAVLIVVPSVDGVLPQRVAAWVSTHPLRFIAASRPSSLLLGAGLLLVLTATTNGFIRAVLRASGTRFENSGERLRGGRIIGVLERWLILALIVGQSPTAAALVVSAKSLVRFPEINRAVGPTTNEASDGVSSEEIGYVTEYFLLGSLLSWGAAIVAAFLLAT